MVAGSTGKLEEIPAIESQGQSTKAGARKAVFRGRLFFTPMTRGILNTDL